MGPYSADRYRPPRPGQQDAQEDPDERAAEDVQEQPEIELVAEVRDALPVAVEAHAAADVLAHHGPDRLLEASDDADHQHDAGEQGDYRGDVVDHLAGDLRVGLHVHDIIALHHDIRVLQPIDVAQVELVDQSFGGHHSSGGRASPCRRGLVC